jgi:Family of unknown function (DUF6167)
MPRRLFWFAAGIAAGGWATMKMNQVARRLTPHGLAATTADRAVELGSRARQFAYDVGEGMHRREVELNAVLGLDPQQAELPEHRSEIVYKQKEDH